MADEDQRPADAALSTTTAAPAPADRLDDLARRVQASTDAGERARLTREYARLFIANEGGLPDVAPGRARGIESLVDQMAYHLGDDGPDVTATLAAEAEETLGQERRVIVPGRTGYLPDPPQRGQHTHADPVTMFNGQFGHEVVDFRIDGAGIDFVFRRTYASQVCYQGPLGANWTHTYDVHLFDDGNAVRLTTGDLREDTYTRHPQHGYFVPPDGEHAVVLPEGDSFVRRAPEGVRHVFEPDVDWGSGHRLRRIEDRFGNYLAFEYADGRLRRARANHPSRTVDFACDALGRIETISDYTGRVWRYAYDDWNDLVAATTPGTARYPAGLTTAYEYSSPSIGGALAHNLLRIVDPAGRVFLENAYGTEAATTAYNRVVRQRQGSGEALFEYEWVDQVFDRDYPDTQRPVSQTNYVDRNGHPIHFVYNRFGNLLLKEELVRDGGRLRRLAWQYRYNADGEMIAALSPEGRLVQQLYGRDQYLRQHGIRDEDVPAHEQLTVAARQAFGRRLSVVDRGSQVSAAAAFAGAGAWGGADPDVFLSNAEDVVVRFTYEPDYGQILTTSDPRFTHHADPSADALEAPDYFAALTRHEYTGPAGDPHRLLSRIVSPSPTWPNGDDAGAVIEQFTEYDDRGRLREQISAGGTVTRIDYWPEDEEMPERTGHTRRHVVDPEGLAITTEYEVDRLGRTIAIRHPRAAGAAPGEFVTYQAFNELDQIVQVTASAPLGYQTRYFYDRAGQLEREERDARDETGADRPDGPEVRVYTYDEQLNLVSEAHGGADPATHLTTRHWYDGADQPILTVLPAGNRIRRGYDERLLPVSVTRGADTAEASTTRTRFDGEGRRILTIDARGYQTSFVYDPLGRLSRQRDPLGHETRQTYDRAGNLIVRRVFERAPDGTFTLAERHELEYDLLGRCVRESQNLFVNALPAGDLQWDAVASPGPGQPISVEHYHDAAGRLVRSVDPLGRAVLMEYDAADRLVATTDAGGHRTERRYDAHGNLVRRDDRQEVRDPESGARIGEQVFTETFEFDVLDRPVSHVDALGNRTRYAYDSRGNLVRETDPLGNVTRAEFDIYNRRTARIREMTRTGLGGGEPLDPVVTRFGYDANGNPTLLVHPRGQRSRQRFDALDRRISLEYPDGGQTQYVYDADDFLASQRDGNGLARRYTVDPRGRTTRVEVDAAALRPGRRVEGATYESYRYDALGRLRWLENDFAWSRIERDSLGRPWRETMGFTTPDAPWAEELVLLRAFTATGALAGLTLPGGRAFRYHRDPLDQLVRIENVALGAGYPGSPATPAVHDVAAFVHRGRLRSVGQWGNGARTAWAYDGAGRAIAAKHDAFPLAPLLTIQQLWDGAGNMRLRNDLGPGDSRGTVFRFDSSYRLTQEETPVDLPVFEPEDLAPPDAPPPDPLPDGQAAIDALMGSLEQVPDESTWTYDAAGNRLEERAGGQPTACAANDLDQYTAIGEHEFVFDDNGNLVSGEGREYRYDSMDRLVRVIDTATGLDLARFFHEASGRRVLEVADGTARHLVYDGPDPVSEYVNGVLTAQSVYDDRIDAVIQLAVGGDEYWFHLDPAGSVRALTDRSGAEAAAYRYAAFGAALEASGLDQRVRFAGRRLDATLGTYDFRARQYNPAWGRFFQRDPNARFDDAGHLYAYAGNNPVSFVDPWGTERESIANPPRRAHHERASETGDMLRAPRAYLGGVAEGAGTALLGLTGIGQVMGAAQSATTVYQSARALVTGAAPPPNPVLAGLQQMESELGTASSGDTPEARAGAMGRLTGQLWVTLTDLVVGARAGPANAGRAFGENVRPPIAIPESAFLRGGSTARVNVPGPPAFDVSLTNIFRRTIVPGPRSRAVTRDVREWARRLAQKYGFYNARPGGLTGRQVHAGHPFGRSHVFTPARRPTQVMPQAAFENLSAASAEAEAAAARRLFSGERGLDPHDPANPLFARPKAPSR